MSASGPSGPLVFFMLYVIEQGRLWIDCGFTGLPSSFTSCLYIKYHFHRNWVNTSWLARLMHCKLPSVIRVAFNTAYHARYVYLPNFIQLHNSSYLHVFTRRVENIEDINLLKNMAVRGRAQFFLCQIYMGNT